MFCECRLDLVECGPAAAFLGGDIAPNAAVEPSRWRMVIFNYYFFCHGERTMERLLQTSL